MSIESKYYHKLSQLSDDLIYQKFDIFDYEQLSFLMFDMENIPNYWRLNQDDEKYDGDGMYGFYITYYGVLKYELPFKQPTKKVEEKTITKKVLTNFFIYISKIEDDYFIVDIGCGYLNEYALKSNSYKADQIDGLIQFLRDTFIETEMMNANNVISI